jgi:hypothetical protein
VTKAKKSFVNGCPDEGGRGGGSKAQRRRYDFPVEEEYVEENPETSQISYSLHLLLLSKSPVLEFLNNYGS